MPPSQARFGAEWIHLDGQHLVLHVVVQVGAFTLSAGFQNTDLCQFVARQLIVCRYQTYISSESSESQLSNDI